MEPWDGPAAIAFTDGTRDRRDARPQRAASRPLARDDRRLGRARLRGRRARRRRRTHVLRKGRLQPGKLFLVDLAQGRIVPDEEVKAEVATPPAVRRVVRARDTFASPTCRRREPRAARRAAAPAAARVRLHAGGHEGDARAARRERARRRSARWGTTRRSPCSRDRQPLLYSYFKQLFAQVTNPPIDSDPRGGRDERRRRSSAPSATCSTRRPSTRASS